MNGIGIKGGEIIVEGAVAECECCPDCEYPLLDVTLTWTDTDTTKDYLGETFTNGETIAICPEVYLCELDRGTYLYNGTSPLYYNIEQEKWIHVVSDSLASPFQVNVVDKVYTPGGYTGTYSFTEQAQPDFLRLYNSYAYRQNPPFTFLYNQIFRQKDIGIGRGGTDAVVSIHDVIRNTSSFGNFYKLDRTATANIGGNTPTTTTGFKGGITDDFEGSITSAGGLTITWAKNHTGIPWGDCFT